MGKAEPVKLENWTDIKELVAMSIGTDKGRWWADSSFGSELWVLRQEDIQCTAERRGKNEIDYALTITKSDGGTIFIKDVWHGIG